ncbi:hypothetical protein HOY82DRAFT_652038 [Tuber indicum]|nr:hypothetical protein HOY82DRAFT_652038 [Tuber indicum]
MLSSPSNRDMPKSIIVGLVSFHVPWGGYALIKIDKSKIDTTNFAGNTLDLGTEITQERFTQLMFPNPENNHTYQYPLDRLFRARGIITDSEKRSPTMQDQHGNRCLIVMKRGSTTGLTVGRANTIASYLRQTGCASESEKSKEWAIYSFDKRSGPFSAHGDSGSVIVDCLGRIGGLLTGGDGLSGSLDISYATPVSFILDSLVDNGYHVTTEAALLA